MCHSRVPRYLPSAIRNTLVYDVVNRAKRCNDWQPICCRRSAVSSQSEVAIMNVGTIAMNETLPCVAQLSHVVEHVSGRPELGHSRVFGLRSINRGRGCNRTKLQEECWKQERHDDTREAFTECASWTKTRSRLRI